MVVTPMDESEPKQKHSKKNFLLKKGLKKERTPGKKGKKLGMQRRQL